MKPIAIKELQEALFILTFQAGNMTTDNTEEVREDIRRAIAHIHGAIFSETPSTSRKFDLYKMTCDDMNTRPAMCGVFHQDGYKVASDTHVLFAVKESYDEHLEGHILDKTGQDIIGKYPNWHALTPKKEEGQGYALDTAKVYELIRKQKAEKKVLKCSTRPAYVKIADAFFRADCLAKVCAFMDAYGAKEIRVVAPNRAAAVFAPDGSWAIIMPSYYGRYIDELGCLSRQEPTASIWEKHRSGILAYEAA